MGSSSRHCNAGHSNCSILTNSQVMTMWARTQSFAASDCPTFHFFFGGSHELSLHCSSSCIPVGLCTKSGQHCLTSVRHQAKTLKWQVDYLTRAHMSPSSDPAEPVVAGFVPGFVSGFVSGFVRACMENLVNRFWSFFYTVYCYGLVVHGLVWKKICGPLHGL